MEIKLDMTQTVCLGVLVFLAGQFVVSKVHFLEKYCIPAPAVGGLLFSIINMAGVQTGAFQFAFDQTLKDFFMIAFFSTIGFSASLKIIKKGGIAIFILFCTSSVMLIIQNVWGVAIARAFGLNPLLGMCAGSISLMGGVGSSAAFAPIMEQNGAVGGLTFAIASATFGLVMGGLISGPIAKFLIDRHKLKDVRKTGVKEVDYGSIEVDEEASVIEVSSMHKAFFQIIIAMGAGTVISKLISLSGMVFPAYVGAIFAAAFIRTGDDTRHIRAERGALRHLYEHGGNGGEAAHIKVYTKEIDALGSLFLNIFLAMTIMALELWELAALALPLIIILIGQVILLAVFAALIIYNTNGRDYDAAVMAAGFYGYAMGATPNAMASMSAVVSHYDRPSPKAFFTVPIVGGFLMDFAMAILIITHMNLILAGVL